LKLLEFTLTSRSSHFQGRSSHLGRSRNLLDLASARKCIAMKRHTPHSSSIRIVARRIDLDIADSPAVIVLYLKRRVEA
jgi:hypothetical protein